MSLKSRTEEIDGISITSTQFPAMKAYRLFARLGKLLAPSVGAIASAEDGQDTQSIGDALTGLFAQLDEKAAEDLALQLLAASTVRLVREGKPDSIISLTSKDAIDAAFGGSLMAMLGAMKLAAEVNFADFIASALTAVRARRAAAAAAQLLAAGKVPELQS